MNSCQAARHPIKIKVPCRASYRPNVPCYTNFLGMMYSSKSAKTSFGGVKNSFALQVKSARSMERQAAQQAQQSANSLRHTSSILRTPSLSGALRGMRIRGGETGAEGAAPAPATPVPEKATKSVPAHDGGCFTCAFDR